MTERGRRLPFLLLAAAAAASGDVRMLGVDDSSLRLEHRVTRPCAPSESVLVGLPPGAEPTLHLLTLEEGPAGIVCGEGSGGPEPEVWLPPPAAAELLDVGRFRRQRVARIRFSGRRGQQPLGRVVAELRFTSPRGPGGHASRGTDEALYAGTVLNHEQARRWRLPRRPREALRPAAGASTGPAYKITIRSTGLYRLTGADLPGARGAASAGLALLYGGGRPLDPDELRGAHPLEPVAVIVDDGGDGTFDEEDQLLFYGEASSRWEGEGDDSRWLHNPFTGENAYWLATADPDRALRGEPRPPPAAAAEAADRFTERVRLEGEHFPTHTTAEKIASGIEWYWLTMSAGDEETFPAVLRSPAEETPGPHPPPGHLPDEGRRVPANRLERASGRYRQSRGGWSLRLRGPDHGGAGGDQRAPRSPPPRVAGPDRLVRAGVRTPSSRRGGAAVPAGP